MTVADLITDLEAMPPGSRVVGPDGRPLLGLSIGGDRLVVRLLVAQTPRADYGEQ